MLVITGSYPAFDGIKMTFYH